MDCKWYNFGEGSCPFGTSCFYRHANADGTLESSTLRVIVGEEDAKIVHQIRLSDFL
jgi:E3 ubiquitin-protein ligase makorin